MASAGLRGADLRGPGVGSPASCFEHGRIRRSHQHGNSLPCQSAWRETIITTHLPHTPTISNPGVPPQRRADHRRGRQPWRAPRRVHQPHHAAGAVQLPGGRNPAALHAQRQQDGHRRADRDRAAAAAARGACAWPAWLPLRVGFAAGPAVRAGHCFLKKHVTPFLFLRLTHTTRSARACTRDRWRWWCRTAATR